MLLPSDSRILITGANGFVGRHLVSALLASGLKPENIVATTLHEKGLVAPGVTSLTMDVSDASQVRSVVADSRPTHLFHLAAISAVTIAQRAVRKTWSTNVDGTLSVALAVTERAPECRLIYCSSAAVYGASLASGNPVDENAALSPIDPYGASKAAADLMIGQMTRQGLRAIRLRPFNHTGVGQTEEFVVPSFAAQIAQIERGEKDPVLHVGDLSPRRDFLDVRDVVDAYVRVLERFDDFPPGAVLNVASGNAVSVREILDTLLSFTEKQIEVRPDPSRMRRTDAPVIVGNAALARRQLDWEPRYGLRATLEGVLEGMREAGRVKTAAPAPLAENTKPHVVARERTVLSPWVTLEAISVAALRSETSLDVYHALRQPDYVGVIVMTPEGRFLLVRQFRPVVDGWTLEFPAGLREEREDPRDTVAREIKEETGFEALRIVPVTEGFADVGRLTNRFFGYFALARPVSTDVERGISTLIVSGAELKEHAASGRIVSQNQIGLLYLASLNREVREICRECGFEKVPWLD